MFEGLKRQRTGPFGRSPAGGANARRYLTALQRCARTLSTTGPPGQRQAPSRYVVLVSPGTWARIGSLQPALERNLAQQLQQFLQSASYRQPPEPLEVILREDSELAGPRFQVQGFLRPRPPAAGLRLHLQDAAGSGWTQDLPEGCCVVGRGPECEVVLQDESVSQRHLELERIGPQVLLRDLGSHNGTFLGRKRLSPAEERSLPPGETVRLGRSQLHLEEF